MLQQSSLENVTKTIINLVNGKTIELGKRTEWYVKIIQKMGLDPNNIPSDFDGLYLYTLVVYGMTKNEATLNLFSGKLVKDIFRTYFEKNDHNLFVKAVGEFLESEKGISIGFSESELRYEFEGFKWAFEILSKQSKDIHEIQDDKKVDQINNQVAYLLDEVAKLKRGMENTGNTINIVVGGNFDGNLTVGNGNQSIKDSYNEIAASPIDPELKQSLKELVQAVETMIESMNKSQSAEVTEDLGKLVNEAVKPKPNPKWYSVSIEGLIKAAENVEKVGEPVINLSRKILSLLSGGVIR